MTEKFELQLNISFNFSLIFINILRSPIFILFIYFFGLR